MWLSLRPIPRDRTRGERGGRAIGILSEGISEITPWEPMRKALVRKAKHYGTPDLPLIVALGALDRYAELDHAMDALYGTDACVISADGRGHGTRLPDGVWNGPRGPQCTRLSAVLVADRLGPWTLGQRGGMFVENLWAARPAGFVDFRVDAWRKGGDCLRMTDGVTLQDLFGVPRDWPETPGAATDPY